MKPYRIETASGRDDARMMTPDWVVVCDWLGAERIVFRGTLFGCLRFVAENFPATP